MFINLGSMTLTSTHNNL